MSNDPAIDRASLLALQRGAVSELNAIIARWQRPLISFAYRYVQNSADSQDLVAETFVRLYQQRFRLRADTNLSAWLFTALTNSCHNHHRWKRRHPTVSLDGDGGNAGEGGTSSAPEHLAARDKAPGEELAHDESVTALRQAVEGLPHELKTTVLLHHYEHMSYREIAAITRCSERGVETRLYRARQQLKQDLAAFLRESSRL